MKSHLISSEVLTKVLALGIKRQFKKGYLFKDLPAAVMPLYFIEKGVIISLSSTGEGYSTFWISVEHEFIYNNSFLNSERDYRPMILEAIEPVEVVEIQRDILFDAFHSDPQLVDLLRLLAEHRMMCLETTNKIISTKSALKRYQLFLQLLPHINGRVPLKHIASWLQMDQATLSRVRNKRNM